MFELAFVNSHALTMPSMFNAVVMGPFTEYFSISQEADPPMWDLSSVVSLGRSEASDFTKVPGGF